MFHCFQVFSGLELELAEFKTITVIVMNLGQTKSDGTRSFDRITFFRNSFFLSNSVLSNFSYFWLSFECRSFEIIDFRKNLNRTNELNYI